MPFSKQLERIARNDKRAVDYEFIGDGEEAPHWLHLASGWRSPGDLVHCINGATVREVLEYWPPIPCDCVDCEYDRRKA